MSLSPTTITPSFRTGVAASFVIFLCACQGEPDADPVTGNETVTATGAAGATDTADLRVSRSEYRDRLAGLWLAESIANWTGLITEGRRIAAPFYTDEDWGTLQHYDDEEEGILIDFRILDPWPADDDTDVEYIYIDAMQRRGDVHLTREDIHKAWLAHIVPADEGEQYIWVSNWKAYGLMSSDPPALPPSTSLFAANDQSLMIDAQLTTEIFGALAPGMPAVALELADLPIRTTASGYSAHAAQFHVALYSLAPAVDRSLAPREQVLWLARTARRLIPDTSKSADVIDLVLEDYMANADRTDWERTRDLVYDRFHANDEANGYRYLEWYEAPVNLAGGLIALLYGEGDLKDTIRIGTLSGWDSDNGTASMAGLLGLLLGVEGVRAAFPDHELSLEYKIDRTRKGFSEPVVSMGAIANRLLTLVDKVVTEAGGSVEGDVYRIQRPNYDDLTAAGGNPLSREHLLSANNATGSAPAIRVQGGKAGADSAPEKNLVDGLEFDYSGRDRQLYALEIDAYQEETPENICVRRDGAEPVSFEVEWTEPQLLEGLRFVEGAQGEDGGYFESVELSVRADGEWRTVEPATAYSPNTDRAFDIHELRFDEALTASGVRLAGTPGGSAHYVTLCEIDGLRAVDE